ncbi:MAG: hypothetical protein ACOC4G_02975 [Bacillota bacterium]
MKCKICGNEAEKGFLCSECRTKINFLSGEYMSDKRKINLDFDEHRFFSRESTGN